MEKYFQNSQKGNTSWISSSFDSEDKMLHRSETTQKRKRNTEGKNVKKKTKGQTVKFSDSVIKQDMTAWVQLYSPKRKEQLAVNKKKILELEDWLKQAYSVCSQNKAAILLLTGPSGCGKSATVKVLASELNIDLKEWSNAHQPFTQSDWEYGTYSSFTNQTTLFSSFLLHENKYPAVLTKCNCQRLILVEEYPNSYLRDASLFHSVLRKFQKMGRCPLIFILSDNSRGQSYEQLLFPKHLLEELNVSVISFNPASSTMMLKVLQQIAQDCNLLGGESKSRKAILENIVSCSSGDIRNAINCLQFMNNKKAPGHSSYKSSKNKSDAEIYDIGRDTSLFLFHSLGKILYCKRETALYEDVFCPEKAHLNRPRLKENPEEVFCKTSITNAAYNLFLHQNYLDFMDNIENISDCCAYFSDSDIICSDWTEQNALQDYSASIVSRSLMFHLYSSTAKNRWRPLHKPQWYTKQKTYNMNFAVLRNIHQRWKISARELKTQLLPYLAKISSLKLTMDERIFVSKYDVFTCKYRKGARTNTLGEKEGVEEMSVTDSAVLGNILHKVSDDEVNEEEYVIEEDDD